MALIRREEPAAKIARRYGISEPTPHRLRDQFVGGGEAGLARKAKGNAADRREIEEPRDWDSAYARAGDASRWAQQPCRTVLTVSPDQLFTIQRRM